jgi:hypothetical protein
VKLSAHRLLIRIFISLLAMAVFSAVPVFANTITVTNTLDSGPGSLRDAIATAAPGDTINFSVAGTITLNSTLSINTSLTISGPGASNLAISGNNSVEVFAISSGATVTISGVTIENGSNSAGGGGISNAGTMIVTNSTLSGNFTSYAGGGILNYGTLTVTNSTLSGNSASNSGGGIFNYGTMAVTNSTVSRSSSPYGGGIVNSGDSGGGTMTVTNSTLSGNIAGYLGGGILNSGKLLTVTNSTLSGNSAEFGYGGGIWNNQALTLSNTTLSGNFGYYAGGGIFNNGGTLTAKNTIVANSSSGGNCAPGGAAIISQGHNLSDDTSCSSYFAQTGDLNNTAAGLDPSGLQNNGGPTQTIALLATSPAVDAIPVSPINYCTATDGTTPIATDQRGIRRPQGPACDIGAFELARDTTPPLVSNVLATPDPVAINNGVILTATVDDSTTGGSNIASAQYSVNGGPFIPMQAADSTFDGVTENVIASVAPFSAAGVYNLCVTGTDSAGNTSDPSCIPLPVYDPSGGFVTGGGSILSPAGKDLVNTAAAGPATFGFVSKYLKGTSTPSGNLEFHFDAGNLHFKSTSMDWLVVTGEPRAQFHGTGTINGASVCQFAVDAWSKSFRSTNGSVDAFGIKVYSCNSGGDGNGNRYSIDHTPLSGGSIIIHK